MLSDPIKLIEKRAEYRVSFDRYSPSWCPSMHWYEDYDMAYPFYCFARPLKLMLTTPLGQQKDLTHLL